MRGWKLLVVLCAGNAPLPHPCRPLAAPVPHGMHLDSSLCGGVGEWRLRIASLLAWLARNPPTLVQHNPAIHGDSAQTKGTVLLSIVSSS